jgi:hypothetical protein
MLWESKFESIFPDFKKFRFSFSFKVVVRILIWICWPPIELNSKCLVPFSRNLCFCESFQDNLPTFYTNIPFCQNVSLFSYIFASDFVHNSLGIQV